MYIKRNFNEPDSCIFSYIKSLTWDVWGFFCVCVNSHLLLLNYTLVSSAKAPMYPASSLTSLEQSPRAVWQAAIPGYSTQRGHWRKHNSQLLSCAILVRATQPKHPVVPPDKRGEAGKATISSEQALSEYLGCDSFSLLNLGTPSEGWMLPCLLNLDRRQETHPAGRV